MEQQIISDLGGMAYIVLAVYLLVLLVIGYVGYRKSKVGEEDYYLAGRGQGWVVSSLTIMATFFSSFALLGAPGMVYRDGVVFALFALNVPLSGAMIYVLGSKIHRIGKANGYVTPADMLCDYYKSPIALRLLVAITGFLYAVPYVVMQIQAGGILAAQLFPGENSFVIGAVLLSAITMLYIMIGGMRSVAWTDVIQGGLLIFGMLVAGVATMYLLGGVSGFFARVAELPKTSLSVPGTTGYWSPEMLFTVCFFASMGSMVQPAQWMRYYSASSTLTLRRSAIIFTVVLTICYLFGIMLVGLGGQVLYPLDTSGAVVLPHPDVGTAPGQFDQILVVILKNHLPQLLGIFGSILAAVIMVAIMAAAMSTADSNLHALSAILTRDIYDRYVNPEASEAQRTWVGRAIIFLATALALSIVIVSRTSATINLVGMIAQLGLLAIAFSSQLLPMAFDMLFVKRGTRQGAVAGIACGLAVVFLLSPLWPSILGGGGDTLSRLRTIIDIGAWGLLVNVVVFAVTSLLTRKTAVVVVLACMALPVSQVIAQSPPDERIAEAAPDSFKVAFETSKGTFDLVVYRSWAPLAADRFYHLVRLEYYNETSIYRVVPGYVAQFGIHNDEATNRAWRPLFLEDEPVIQSNARGTIAFARGGPKSRTTQVYINLVDNGRLDTLEYGGVRGYPPFGKIVRGMDEAVALFNGQYANAPAMRQDSINASGRAYLDRTFPGLDYVVTARLVAF